MNDRQQFIRQAAALLLALLVGAYAGMLMPRGNQAPPPAPPPAPAQDSDAVPAYAAWLMEDDHLLLAGETPETTAEAQEENLFAISPVSTPVPTPGPSAAQTPAPTAQPGFAIEVLGAQTAAPRKRVLIYHTHTYEAYEPTKDDPYQPTEQWRTADSAHNVVRVGEELAGLLRGLGVEVVHDVTAFEPPNLGSAYTRSLEMLTKRIQTGERYDLYIDLHRDAYAASYTGPNTVAIGGVEAAKLMLLIGKGDGQTGQGFDEKPNWQGNLSIAQTITDALNAQGAGLCRDVCVKSGRFNQHVSLGCVLIEAGNNHNTLKEVLAAMPYLADAIAQYLCQ
ncbi:MAG: stage II sporulation protein P [Clostridiales bacterium]|nr:stage II sporulation protein P [Clostridiales bacterium]MDY4009068.1 stage II sporulation protein P [Candidatus Limiplasma sp.]